MMVRFAGLGALALGALALWGSSAGARSPWWEEARIQVTVHEHAFHRVTVNAIGCALRVRLYFDAPVAAYREPAEQRNHYRFTPRVTLSDGRRFVAGPFHNAEPGARVIAFSHDTASEGCWAERPHALRKVDVHACRGRGCVPEAFE